MKLTVLLVTLFLAIAVVRILKTPQETQTYTKKTVIPTISQTPIPTHKQEGPSIQIQRTSGEDETQDREEHSENREDD